MLQLGRAPGQGWGSRKDSRSGRRLPACLAERTRFRRRAHGRQLVGLQKHLLAGMRIGTVDGSSAGHAHPLKPTSLGSSKCYAARPLRRAGSAAGCGPSIRKRRSPPSTTPAPSSHCLTGGDHAFWRGARGIKARVSGTVASTQSAESHQKVGAGSLMAPDR
jgi:hypothetical protein